MLCCGIVSAPVQNNFILLSDWTHNRMYQIDNAAQTVHAVATPLTEQATTLVYNPNTQKIIWSSNQREEVIEVNLDGTGETVLGKIGTFEAFLSFLLRQARHILDRVCFGLRLLQAQN